MEGKSIGGVQLKLRLVSLVASVVLGSVIGFGLLSLIYMGFNVTYDTSKICAILAVIVIAHHEFLAYFREQSYALEDDPVVVRDYVKSVRRSYQIHMVVVAVLAIVSVVSAVGVLVG